MKKSMFLGSLLLVSVIVQFHSLNVFSIDNTLIHFNAFKGKKVLIVNTASGSSQANQLLQLQALYEQHIDSVVVIAFPSNSFGNEPLNNDVLSHYMRDSLGISFPIAAKSSVTGIDANIVYRWFASKSQNLETSEKVETDFQKFLIDGKGRLVGVFDSSISPTGTVMQNAIRMNGY